MSAEYVTSSFITHYGYIMDNIVGHPLLPKLRRILRHRRIMSEKLGRPIEKGEVVHHIDGNRLNNDPDNLELLSKGMHTRRHHAGKVTSEETKKLMSERAVIRCSDPEWRSAISERMKITGSTPEWKHAKSEQAKKQWADGNIGRKAAKEKE
jgi:hypothetical protein